MGGQKWGTQNLGLFWKSWAMKFFTQQLVSGKVVQNVFLNINLKTEFILDLPFRSYDAFSPPPQSPILSFRAKIVHFYIKMQISISLALCKITIWNFQHMFLKVSLFRLGIRLLFKTRGRVGEGHEMAHSNFATILQKPIDFFWIICDWSFSQSFINRHAVPNSFLNQNTNTELILDIPYRSYDFFPQPPHEPNFVSKFIFQNQSLKKNQSGL